MISLKNKNIVIIYMLYFGDMVSLSPFQIGRAHV